MLLFLFGITLIALLLRIAFLGEVPVGFHRDEAFLGYNAYSIFLTGKDMTGHVLPLHLASFLFSPAGYSYAAIPFIAILGLTDFSVRLPAALFGTATVVITYFLVKALFNSENSKKSVARKTSKSENQSDQKSSGSLASLKNLKSSHSEFSDYSGKIALLSAFFLAISPWHINLSRTATENVIVVFLISLGGLLYLKWIKKERWWLLLVSFFFFGVSLYVYQAPRSFLPLFLPLLFLIFPPRAFSFSSLQRLTILKSRSVVSFLLLYVVVIIFPILSIISSPDLSERFRMLSIFNTAETQLLLDEQIREDGVAGISPAIARIFHNKVINYSDTFLTTYFSHFSYDFLFTDAGGPDRYRVPGMGILYLWDLPLLIIGITVLLTRKRRLGIFLLGWVLFAPVGSGLTYDDVPNLQRTLLTFPALSLLSAVGASVLWKATERVRFSPIPKIILFAILLYGVADYIHQYYVHQVIHRPWHRQEGYKELVTKVNQVLPTYPRAVITEHETVPLLFFLFYTSYPPEKIQPILTGYHGGRFPAVEKYTFSSEQCPLRVGGITDSASATERHKIIGKKGVLYVNHGACEIKDNRIDTIAEIKRTDGTTVFQIQKVK